MKAWKTQEYFVYFKFYKLWCSAQRIKITMIAGGNHTTIYQLEQKIRQPPKTI